MTAFELIDSILNRPQDGMPANERIVTPDQLRYLRVLISMSGQSSALRNDGAFRQVWTPEGQRKFLIIESWSGRGHKLIEIAVRDSVETGMLF